MMLPETRTITVYRNGDGHFVGRRIVVHPRMSSLGALLDHLASVRAGPGQGPVFGAVRRLYTVQGVRVRRAAQVEAGGRYVAAGNEGFRRLSYLEISTKKPQTKVNEEIRPVVHSWIQASSRWAKTKDGACTIYVFTNGEVLLSPVRIRIPKFTLKSWNNVLSIVTEKVRLRSGAVHRLCTADGRTVSGSAQLRNQQHYVAVGAERFKALPYDLRLHTHLTRRCTAEQSTKSEAEERKSTTSDQTRAAERRVSGGSSVFGGSVFMARRRRSELAGAAEVQEDGWVSVGPPINETEAKTRGQEDASPCSACLRLPLNMTSSGPSAAAPAPKLHK